MSRDLHDLLARNVNGPTRTLDTSNLVKKAKRGTRVRRAGGLIGIAVVVGAAVLAATLATEDSRNLTPEVADAPEGGDRPPMSEIDEGAVAVLLKENDWREDPPRSLVEEEYMRLLEIAYDAETGQRLWDDNGPQSSPGDDTDGSDLPYDIDYSHQALVVWSSGESGSCPETLEGIITDESGAVTVELTQPEPHASCTEDFNRYRVVAAVNLDSVPHLENRSDASVADPPRAAVVPYP